MENNNNIFVLRQGKAKLISTNEDALRIVEGSVRVYLAPIINDIPGRRCFLSQEKEGSVFPGFDFSDYEDQRWAFLIVADKDTKYHLIEDGNTKVLQRKFCERNQIPKYAVEGFAGALIDYYHKTLSSERGSIYRTKKEREEVGEDISKVIYNVFQKPNKKKRSETEAEPDPLYKAVEKICVEKNIPILPFFKIRNSVEGTYSIEDIARLSNFACREIVLEEDWYQSDAGPILAFTQEGNHPMACIPSGRNHYILYNPINNKSTKLTQSEADTFSLKAYSLYRPLPNKKLSFKDIMSFSIEGVQKSDFLSAVFLTLIMTLLTRCIPDLQKSIFGEKNMDAVLQMTLMMGSFMLAKLAYSIVNAISIFRISSHVANDLQSAFYDRVFNLPQSDLDRIDSGDLALRVSGVSSLASSFADTAVETGLSTVFSVLYVVELFRYGSILAFYSLLMVSVYILLSGVLFKHIVAYERDIVTLNGKLSGLMLQFVNAVAKLRMAGSENRVVYEYMKPFAELQEKEIQKGYFMSISNTLDASISYIIFIVLYILIVKRNIALETNEYMAFAAAFGLVTESMLSLLNAWKQYYTSQPMLTKLQPILQSIPENDNDKEILNHPTGHVALNHVSFQYGKDGPPVLRDLSLSIRAGEYVGIVGPSGCGKSTLLKLLMGFETPTSGSVLYDNQDLQTLNKRELRRKMGVVLQNDTTITGSIIENIRLTAPEAKYSDIQKLIRDIGLEDDIKRMPMGLRTVISERGNTISGGQKQRITIARALINKPKIIFFDEATSALDNVTQEKVVNTLATLPSTRIVIAHRLSTVLQCDRIIVMDRGRIVEHGSYDELMERKGTFYTLALRQLA